ncbi:MAG: hypothetical protein K7J15_05200, partial [Candidatus Regiella insecticola]|nr:hypothetical protein [Candidatus Regiella insecticola]
QFSPLFFPRIVIVESQTFIPIYPKSIIVKSATICTLSNTHRKTINHFNLIQGGGSQTVQINSTASDDNT